MTRTARRLTFALTAVSLLALGAGRAAAQTVILAPAPAPSYYSGPPVTYYSPPVIYAPAPQVSYYTPPAVSYYPPSVSYYAPPVAYSSPVVSSYAVPATVTTTRYGLFGRPLATTTYYPPVYMVR